VFWPNACGAAPSKLFHISRVDCECIIGRGKVKTKHDITWLAQKTNVDQLNPAYTQFHINVHLSKP
jgi:hypothetical protein